MVFWIKKLRIEASVKVNYKQLKDFLIPEIKKLGFTFLALNLNKFLFFDKFWNLTNFSLFDFLNLNNFLNLTNFLFFAF